MVSLIISIVAYILIGVLFYFVRLYWLYINGFEHFNACSFRYWFYNVHSFTYVEIVYASLWPVFLTLLICIYVISFICYILNELT